MKKLSVLIPAYNTGRYIGQCIESVINQTYTNIEIIIVDDGSEDSTLEVANRYAEIDARIVVYSYPHSGVSGARNACLSKSTGEYFLFVDSDDWIGPSLCYELMEKARETDADIVFSQMTMVGDNGSTVLFGDRSDIFSGNDILSGMECFIKMVETGDTYPMVAGNLYRLSLIAKNNLLFEGEFHEDEFFMPPSLRYADVVCYLSSSAYFYRMRSNSIMHDVVNIQRRSFALGEIISSFRSQLAENNEISTNIRYARAFSKHIKALRGKARTLFEFYLSTSNKNVVLIFSEKGISSNYGIGTYINQLSISFKDTSWDIIQVRLDAPDVLDVEFSISENLPCYSFPSYMGSGTIPNPKDREYYQMGIFYFLAAIIGDRKKIVCHLNTFNYEYIAKYFKERLQARIIFTVHYTNWAFRLMGDQNELLRIIKASYSTEDNIIKESFIREKEFLNSFCDWVIAIAQHSYDYLRNIYEIPEQKLRLIYNHVFNSYRAVTPIAELRDKYGFNPQDKLIIFAGRIDRGKGINELIDAFKKVIQHNSDARLIIVGDGAFSLACIKSAPIWSKVTFTGYVDKDTLYELYRLSNIGVVPSLHEEFGYVAIEMASVGLPVLVNPKGGLKEIAENFELVFDASDPKKTFTDSLADKILEFLSDNGQEECRPQRVNWIEASSSQGKLLELYQTALQSC